MVNKIAVNPLGVRGAGNIVSPKTLSDFNEFNSDVTSAEEDVNGTTMTVYTGTYQIGSYFDSLSVPRFIQYNESVTSFSVSAVLKYHNGGSLITGAEVSLYVNSDTVLTGTTGSDGKVTFTVPLDATDGLYRCRLVFSGNSNVGGGFLAFKTVVGTVKECNLYGKNDVIMQTGDTVSYVGEVLAEDLGGNSVPVKGQTVNLLAYNPELFKYIGVGELVYDGTGTAPTSVSGNFYAELGNIAQTRALRFTAVNNNCIILLMYTTSFNLSVSIDGSLVIDTELNGRGFKLIDGVLYYNDTLYDLGFTDEFTIGGSGATRAWTLYSFPTEVDRFLYNRSQIRMVTEIDGTTITGLSGSDRWYYTNLSGTSSNIYDYFGECCVDFDVVSYNGVVKFVMSDSINMFTKLINVSNAHIQVVYDGENVYWNVDGVTDNNPALVSFDSNFSIRFNINAGATLKFKNFVIGGF